jgi:hypothetical protein
MSALPREYLMIVEESAYKTPVASPVVWSQSTTYGLANAQAYYLRLDGGNAFTMRPRPVQVSVPYGGGVAIEAFRVSDKAELKGQLNVKLCVGQAPFLLSWAGQRITGGTAPWTTSEPNGDLASCSIYHAIVRSDGSVKRRVYLGCKVDSWALSVSEDSTVSTLSMQISGSTPQGNQFDSSTDPTAGTFPAPADNNFPIDPYVFLHLGGTSFVTYGGAVRTQFTEMNINSTNILARRFYANRYIQLLRFMGRKTTVSTKLQYPLAAQDDRTNYEATASETASIELGNGTHSVTFGLNGQNVLGPLEDDLALSDIYFQSSTSNNMLDSTAGSDFTLTFA